ncbi:M56 family metallopeptidase [Dyadobacter sp. CY343]|uniref:M56 family metallopeptidase n=1 Tax=Dyadobacter sp. CY343 TaxID=2907299 RepID=UPI001F47E72E|nr:M56 family metallopeptidase [Dyadobacter sp. CY343]MCE7063447.1 TonB family protein [Dyadobacter sp. CY343]
MDMLLYIGKVNLYWILLFACYRLMLRNHTFFQWNRIYLLGSIAIAFALPFVIYPETAPTIPAIYEVNSAPVSITFEQQEEPLVMWTEVAWFVYIIGLIISFSYLVRHILQLRNFLKSGEVIELEDCTVVMIDSNKIGSFSFLKWIVINRNDYESHFDDILCHEMVHTRQWHSADILFLEIMKVLFWFNPILLLYKRDLQEVHEFLADSKASNRENYARFLVSYALNAPVASLTNHFFKPSQLKSRIQMIYKNRSPKWLLSTYLAAATLIGATALFVAGCEQREDKQPETAKTGEEKMPDKVFTVVETQPKYPGGETAMFQFLARNIKYPTAAAKANVQGKVFVSFIVTESGNVQNVSILKGIGFGCDDEAMRVVKSMPAWAPGEQSGHKVNVKVTLPINFQLEENTAKLSSEDVKGNPLYIVDGKEMKKEDVQKNVQSYQIASVNVLKGDQAIASYGSKAKGGVIDITTKPAKPEASNEATVVHISDKRNDPASGTAKVRELNPGGTASVGVRFKGDPSAEKNPPLYIIDGVKQTDGFSASELDPDKIESISVLKKAGTTDVYGEEGKNGVVLITTKKN